MKNQHIWESNTETGEFSLKPYRLEHPQIAFHDKLVFDDGKQRAELIRLGPAHTRGDEVAWLPKERILFSGDLCVHSPGNNMLDADTDPDHWLTAIDAMVAFKCGQNCYGSWNPRSRRADFSRTACLSRRHDRGCPSRPPAWRQCRPGSEGHEPLFPQPVGTKRRTKRIVHTISPRETGGR